MLDNKTLIPIVNKKSSSYSAILPSGEYYEWMPSTGGIEDSIEIPFRDVQFIHTRSATFKEGYLFIDHEEARKRLGLEREEIKSISMSREDIEATLKGNLTTLKKFDKVKDNRPLVREIIQIAKELKVDNINKLTYLSELSGIPIELLQENEDK